MYKNIENNNNTFTYWLVYSVKLLKNISKCCISFIEILVKSVNKVMVLAYINNNFLHIPKEETISIGDSGNDIEMLK